MAKKNSSDRYYAVWPTAWGPIGAVAGEQGLRRIVLPHYTPEDLKGLLGWEHPSAVYDERPFEAFVEKSRAYFNAKPTDFSEILCDLPGESSFSGKVYRACREIPYGQTRSYAELAFMMGQADAARPVATAMSKNTLPLVVPCHRVIYANGELGGFSAEGGLDLKLRMLKLEKVPGR
jgi:methylated-DNA-[protein]-cysteine S-methyltransferase